MKATREELMKEYIPLHARDNCSHLLIPLNKCRRENHFLPWQCHHERHEYEICLYYEYERRREIQEKRNLESSKQ